MAQNSMNPKQVGPASKVSEAHTSLELGESMNPKQADAVLKDFQTKNTLELVKTVKLQQCNAASKEFQTHPDTSELIKTMKTEEADTASKELEIHSNTSESEKRLEPKQCDAASKEFKTQKDTSELVNTSKPKEADAAAKEFEIQKNTSKLVKIMKTKANVVSEKFETSRSVKTVLEQVNAVLKEFKTQKDTSELVKTLKPKETNAAAKEFEIQKNASKSVKTKKKEASVVSEKFETSESVKTVLEQEDAASKKFKTQKDTSELVKTSKPKEADPAAKEFSKKQQIQTQKGMSELVKTLKPRDTPKRKAAFKKSVIESKPAKRIPRLEDRLPEPDLFEVSDDDETAIPSTSTGTPVRKDKYKYPDKSACKFYQNRRRSNGEFVFHPKLLKYFTKLDSPDYHDLKKKRWNTSFLKNRPRPNPGDIQVVSPEDPPIIPLTPPPGLRIPQVTDGPPGEKYADVFKSVPWRALSPVMRDETVVTEIAKKKEERRVRRKMKKRSPIFGRVTYKGGPLPDELLLPDYSDFFSPPHSDVEDQNLSLANESMHEDTEELPQKIVKKSIKTKGKQKSSQKREESGSASRPNQSSKMHADTGIYHSSVHHAVEDNVRSFSLGIVSADKNIKNDSKKKRKRLIKPKVKRLSPQIVEISRRDKVKSQRREISQKMWPEKREKIMLLPHEQAINNSVLRVVLHKLPTEK